MKKIRMKLEIEWGFLLTPFYWMRRRRLRKVLETARCDGFEDELWISFQEEWHISKSIFFITAKADSEKAEQVLDDFKKTLEDFIKGVNDERIFP